MRAALAAAVPGAEAINGTADRLPLADGAAQAVTVAQAFHWFANDEALAEFQRVVGPAAGWPSSTTAATSNSRCSDAWRRCVSRHRGDRVPSVRSGRWREVIDATDPVHGRRGGVVPKPGRDDRRDAGRPGGVDQHHRVTARRQRAAALAEVRALGDAEPERFR